MQGYNLDMIRPGSAAHPLAHNLAHLLVGSEGTLAFSRRITLKLSSIPAHKVLGVVHFPTFYQAMDLTRHIVTLDPDAVELVDRTMIDLARGNAAFRPIVDRFLQGEPEAILLVEFAGEDKAALVARLAQLAELMGDLGLPGSVVQIVEPVLQKEIWEVRKAGLNIMMSMKGDGKPAATMLPMEAGTRGNGRQASRTAMVSIELPTAGCSSENGSTASTKATWMTTTIPTRRD